MQYVLKSRIDLALEAQGLEASTGVSAPAVGSVDAKHKSGLDQNVVIVIVVMASVVAICVAAMLVWWRHKSKIAAEVELLSPEQSAMVRASVQEMLQKETKQTGRMVGGLKNLKTGAFVDAAKGILPFLGVRPSWRKIDECTLDGIVAEVKALCNCPGCAREHARVLKIMKRDQEAAATMRLAHALQCVQHISLSHGVGVQPPAPHPTASIG